MDRTWNSPPSAGLTFSLLVRPSVPISRWGWLPLLAGLALQQSIGHSASLKWPNDVLLGPQRHKVAGILVQAGEGAAVVGIGLNVTTTRAELPVETATSLLLEGFADLAGDRAGMLGAFLLRFGALFDAWEAADGDASRSGLAEQYRAACDTLGSAVAVDFGTESHNAEALDVDSDGRLLVRIEGESTPRALSAGDITHLRPLLR
jgi:BirA family biotin operon repressor/biotin-[acetyl-CoA-carboxylase] ligase